MVLAFFAADNVMSWLASPILFYPILMIMGAFAVVHSMGLSPIVMPLLKQTMVQIARSIKLDRLFF